MKFSRPLISGKLIQRYKRFLADVQLDSGEVVTAHTANSGSMMGLTSPGNQVFLSYEDKATRKLHYSWEIVRSGSTLVGVNTSLPNKLVEEGIPLGVIKELRGYGEIRREVPYGKNSRIDLLLSKGGKAKCFVEVKNVTLVEEGKALFPDAVSERGQKHLLELAEVVKQGHRAVLFYVLQRNDSKVVAPADHIDEEYGKILRMVAKNGVEVLAYQAQVTPEEIALTEKVEVEL
jgi:sugar fermentation stimulation protein A